MDGGWIIWLGYLGKSSSVLGRSDHAVGDNPNFLFCVCFTTFHSKFFSCHLLLYLFSFSHSMVSKLQQLVIENLLNVCTLYFLCMGEGGWFVIFRIFKFILFVVNWISLNFFHFFIKYYHILFIILVFRLGCDRPSGLLLFIPALLLSMLMPLFLPSSSVSLSYFILAVPMREWENTHAWVPHVL